MVDLSLAVTLGAAPDNDLAAARPGVSPYHARITYDGRHLLVTDLGSAEGTYINGQRIEGEAPIRPGDQLGLGTQVSFQLDVKKHLRKLTPLFSHYRAQKATRAEPDADTQQVVRSPGSVRPSPPARPAAPPRPHPPQPTAPPPRSPLPRSPSPPPSEDEGDDATVMLSLSDGLTTAQAQGAPEAYAVQVDEAAGAPLPPPEWEPFAPSSLGPGPAPAPQPDDPGSSAPPQADGPRPSAQADAVSIGYDPDNDVVIASPQVSGHHCRLWKEPDGRLLIEDLGSADGTWVNGARVTRAEVQAGDRLGLGGYQFNIDHTILSHFKKAREQRTQFGQLPPELAAPIRIGRDDYPGVNDIVIDAPQVSNEHCEMQFTGGGWRIRDLGSTNGTYVNSRQNRITEGVVSPKDILFFGSYRFPVSRVLEFLTNDKGGGELSIPTDKEVFTVGRDLECDVTIDAPQVSRKHARLKRLPDGFEIEDLGSANGTYVNGKQIKKAKIGPNDWVGLGSYQIKFDANSNTVARNYHGDLMLQAENVTFKVDKGRKTILNNISFTAYPTEFVGLMGPSGAGKTTLMMCLNGYQPPSEGRSLLNGQDLYGNYNAFRGNIGYVPQDDIIHSQLTVWEALYYTARLRLPPDTTKAEIEQRIMKVLTDLEIEQTRDVLIGSPEQKGISGGQRKRVNLAQELITQPSLLFLDEPTSGLASADTTNVMGLLRKLADSGRTILLTIHQPSLEAYRMMDNIVYLADGNLVYYGPTYPDSILYFNPDAQQGTPHGDRVLADPGNALVPLAEAKRQGQDMTVLAERYRESEYFEEYVVRRQEGGEAEIAGGSKQKTQRRFGLRQWWTLTRRYMLIKLKDRVNTAILLIQAPIIASVIVAVFYSKIGASDERALNAPFALFLLVVSAIWFGCSNAAREIVAEQAIYRRERMVNLKIPSYVMSKFGVLSLVCAVQCVLLLAISYAPLGFEGSPIVLFFVLLVCACAGIGMGLVLSSLVRTSEAAIALVPLLLIPQVILGGLVMPIQDQPMLLREYGSGVMVARWGFEALLQAEDRAATYTLSDQDKRFLEDKALDKLNEEVMDGKREVDRVCLRCPIPVDIEHPVERYFGEEAFDYEGDIGVLITFNLLLIFGVMVILRVKE